MPIVLFTILIAVLYSVNGYPCCVIHEEALACDAEEGSDCVWLDEFDPLYVNDVSMGVRCVTKAWINCEMMGICQQTPKIAVASECLFKQCENDKIPFNIGFVIDESGSVGKTNYMASLNFVENMIVSDINGISRISILAYASRNDRVYSFVESQNDQKSGALTALSNEKQDYNGGSTCTATALKAAIHEFQNTPGIVPSDENILFLMTDGLPNCGGNVCDERVKIDSAGIRVVIVGISSGFRANEVECLVRDPSDILTIPRFDQELFYHLESKLRGVVCPIVFAKEITNIIKIDDNDNNDDEEVLIAEVIDNIKENTQHKYNLFYIWFLLGFVLISFGILYYWRCLKNDNKKMNDYSLIADGINDYGSV